MKNWVMRDSAPAYIERSMNAKRSVPIDACNRLELPADDRRHERRRRSARPRRAGAATAR
jgi:hypothetical protein